MIENVDLLKGEIDSSPEPEPIDTENDGEPDDKTPQDPDWSPDGVGE